MNGAEAATFPVSSIIEIIIAAALIIIAFKLFKSIAKPIVAGILIVAALLLVFGVVDIATFQQKGEDLADNAISCAGSKLEDKVSNSDIGKKTLEVLRSNTNLR